MVGVAVCTGHGVVVVGGEVVVHGGGVVVIGIKVKLAVTVTILAGIVKVVLAEVGLVNEPDGTDGDAVQLTNW